jgi:hypothetical protein
LYFTNEHLTESYYGRRLALVFGPREIQEGSAHDER